MQLARVQYEQVVGGNKNFSVPFSYLSRDHIKVAVDGIEVEFRWLNDTTVTLTEAPPQGAIVDVLRETERQKLLVDFQDASTITEEQLDLAARQSFYLAQEAFDMAGATMALNSDGSLSASGRRLSNVGEPVNPEDVPTMGWVQAQYQSGKDAHVERLVAEEAALLATTAAVEATQTIANIDSYEARVLELKDLAERTNTETQAGFALLNSQRDEAVAAALAAKASEQLVVTNAQESVAARNAAQAAQTAAQNAAATAQTQASNAGNSAGKAGLWAEAAEDSAVETGRYSAKHHALKAAASATRSETAATTAQTHRNAAATSATNAATSATNAATSATTATTKATEATNAAASAAASAAVADWAQNRASTSEVSAYSDVAKWLNPKDGLDLIKKARFQSTLLASGTDLNNIKHTGTYHWETGLVNTPVDYGSMIVTSWTGTSETSQSCEQVVFKNGVIYIRGKNNASASWSAWRTINVSTFMQGVLSAADSTAARNALGVAFTQSLATNGYVKLPNGFILQWGQATFAYRNSDNNVTFPIAFPNASLHGWSNIKHASSQSGLWVSGFVNNSKTGANFYGMYTNDGRDYLTSWFVIGY